MGQAREVFDRFNAALLSGDLDAAAACYADDAVAVTPDQGEIRGREEIKEYLRQFVEAFSDVRYDFSYKHESGNHAIDEGYLVGTHTGALPTPSGETIEPTGKTVRIRDCDIAAVEGGLITSHRFYFDQMEFLGQLGLMQ